MSDPHDGQERPLILVVDDDPDFCDTAEAMLRHLGYRVVLAHSGPAALQAVEDDVPALILLDIYMPGMDGLELLGTLRNAAIYAPVVIASGALLESGHDPLKSAARTLGAEGVLRKPFSAAAIEGLIRSLSPALADAAAAHAP